MKKFSIKKEAKRAAALKYEPEKDKAPRLVAKGEGFLAEKIIALAQEHGIPIKKDAPLLKALYQLEIEAEIPPALYKSVATVLAWAWKLNQKGLSR